VWIAPTTVTTPMIALVWSHRLVCRSAKRFWIAVTASPSILLLAWIAIRCPK
jgi:hypothetical protein